MRTLKSINIKNLRNQWLKEQNFLDPISKRKIKIPNLDHCHDTGFCRGVLDREENAFLGKVENAYKRFLKHKGVSIDEILLGVIEYLSSNKFGEQILHPKSVSKEIKRFSYLTKSLQFSLLVFLGQKVIPDDKKKRISLYRSILNKNILKF